VVEEPHSKSRKNAAQQFHFPAHKLKPPKIELPSLNKSVNKQYHAGLSCIIYQFSKNNLLYPVENW
jgi:hypothetical protein